MTNRVKKIGLICYLALILCSSFKTISEEKPIQLDWDRHFKGIPNNNSPYYAETKTNFRYRYNVKIRDGVFSIEFKFYGGVDSLNSWVKKEKITDPKASEQLLNHEQGHANIGFLHFKEAEIQISSQNYTASNYKNLIEETDKQLRIFYKDMQIRYDNETRHGIDLSAQKRWDNDLTQQLSKYNEN